MAPLLEKVYNVSGKNLYVYMTNGKIFALNHGESYLFIIILLMTFIESLEEILQMFKDIS